MSGLLGVRLLLLLWGCACLTQGALIISRHHEASQESAGAARSLQKRSTEDVTVEVLSVNVDSTVTSRFAHTVMTSMALNKANESQEIHFEVELPKTAFITNFSMEIEGEVYVGEVKEKEKAKKQYEKAVSSGQTAGLVKASGRKMEKFSVSVNIAPNSNVTFVLTYEELLQRKLGKYELQTRVKPKSRVQEFKIVANIFEPQGLAFVDTHATFLSNDLLPLVDKTVTDKKAHISFSPTMEQQRKCADCDRTIIDGDFIITYDVNRAQSLGEIQVVNGYFVHFFAPPDLPRVPKNVVFVIDRSGSMSGRKMDQTKEAMLEILKDIHEDDFIGLIQFDDEVDSWRPALCNASKENLAEAMNYVRTIEANSMTDINAALMEAVIMLGQNRKAHESSEVRSDIIIFMTDGMPNHGVSNTHEIQENVRAAIAGKVSLFSLGFGDSVDYSFLDVMSKQNQGLARRIYEASDATAQLQGFYEEVSSPLLLDVNLHYPDNAVDSLTTNHFNQLFNGSEIVVAGRLMDNDLDNFMVEVYGQGAEDFKQQGQASALDLNVVYPDEEYVFGDYTERLWAYLTIQQLLDTSKSGSGDEKANATAKALDMSLRYSFVTPLTSMVVTKPPVENKTEGPLIANKLTEEQRQQADRSSGRPPGLALGRMPTMYSYAVPMPTTFVDGDPHFVIELPDKRDSLCFNINDRPGTIFTLVTDPEAGILVNGETIGDKQIPPDGTVNTYFGKFGIVHRSLGVRLEISTHEISVFQDDSWLKLVWSDSASLEGPNVALNVTKDRSLTVTLRDSVKFVVLLHKVWAKHPYHQDYLGFYTLDSHLLSPAVHGLLGQFYHGVDYEVSEMRPGEVPEKPDATMFVKGHQLNVTRGWQRDFRRDLTKGENVPCWFVHSNGTGLIDGQAADYIVSGLFKTT